MEVHAEFKDKCQDLESRSEQIVNELRELPVDYRLAERYTILDQEVYDLQCWYDDKKREFEKYEKEREVMENKVKRLTKEFKMLNNDVQNLKLREFSRDQLRDVYLPLYQTQHP